MNKAYDKIEEFEKQLYAAETKKGAIEAEQVTAENIYRVLRNFNDPYKIMDDEERRKLMEILISELQIYENKKENGQWLKSIKFKLPIVEESVNIDLDESNSLETVALIERIRNAKDYVQIGIDAEDYYRIKDSRKESK